jgi:hypothetical protein
MAHSLTALSARTHNANVRAGRRSIVYLIASRTGSAVP